MAPLWLQSWCTRFPVWFNWLTSAWKKVVMQLWRLLFFLSTSKSLLAGRWCFSVRQPSTNISISISVIWFHPCNLLHRVPLTWRGGKKELKLFYFLDFSSIISQVCLFKQNSYINENWPNIFNLFSFIKQSYSNKKKTTSNFSYKWRVFLGANLHFMCTRLATYWRPLVSATA